MTKYYCKRKLMKNWKNKLIKNCCFNNTNVQKKITSANGKIKLM